MSNIYDRAFYAKTIWNRFLFKGACFFHIQNLFIQGQPYLSATSSEISDKRTFTRDDRDSSHDSAA